MDGRNNRFDLFKKNFPKLKKFRNENKVKSEKKNKLDGADGTNSSFTSFDAIIPENSPLKKNTKSDSGFFNDELIDSKSNNINKLNSSQVDDLEGVDEKYAKYIYSEESDYQNDLSSNENYKSSNENYMDSNYKSRDFDNGSDDFFKSYENVSKEGKVKNDLLNFKNKLLNKNNSSKNLFGKITFLLIFLVLISSAFYFFVYQPFQNELDLERNSKLNELNALYKGPLAVNENYYTLETRINKAYDVEELKSIDVLRSATKDWRLYHSSEIVDSKDEFGRVMMEYGENKNIIMSVKDANDFVKDNDAKTLSNVQFEKVNTVIVPVSISRLQATAGLISVGSVVDIYSLNDNSSEYDYEIESNNGDLGNNQSENLDLDSSESSSKQSVENYDSSDSDTLGPSGEANGESLEEFGEGPLISGATVLAILRSKDSGLVDSTVSKSNTIIKGNETNPTENTSSFSSDVEELLKEAVLNSNSNENALDSYLTNYGVRLSNFERMSNLGDLDSNYLILLEVPQSDVNFVINNMDSLILTIPTNFAPNWVSSELNETYYENLYQNQSFDFL